jgi:hypothetical protein
MKGGIKNWGDNTWPFNRQKEINKGKEQATKASMRRGNDSGYTLMSEPNGVRCN